MTEFFATLKQRKLVQWALTYIAAAFALIQVFDIIGNRFGWPESIMRIAIIALAIGFFVTLVLAWYHGERGAQRVSGVELMILALLLTVGGGVLWHVAPGSRELPVAAAAANTSSSSAPAKSIAVLPFTDLSPGKDQEYFSDGMAEELLNALAKIKDLKVAGRTSSFSFKGKNDDLRAIGRTLGVANILEGSVRKQGDKVRITAQLIRTDNDFHLWSETYDGDLSDVFALQERIARAITEKLAVVLHGDSAQPLVKVATDNAEAYALYLQATGIFNRREGKRFPEAISELEQALKLDPKFARAHARLAAIHALEPIYVPAATAAEIAATEREAALAEALDPTLAEPHAALSVIYTNTKRLVDARLEVDRALAIDPDDITASFWGAIELIDAGYTAQGREQLDRVLALDPLLPNALLWRGTEYFYAGDLDRAETLLRRAADVGLAHVGSGLSLVAAARGRKEEAVKQLASLLGALGAGLSASTAATIADGVYGDTAARTAALAVIDEAIAEHPQPTLLPAFIPYTLLLLGEDQHALALISERPSTNRALYMNRLWSPLAQHLRALPEFRQFTQKNGLVALWDRFGAPDACRSQAPGDYICN